MARRHILALLLTASLTAVGAATRIPAGAERAMDAMPADALRAWVTTLASDTYAGRGVGHEGNAAAETYLVNALRTAGTMPGAATASFLQPVDIYEPTLGTHAHLTVTDPSGHALLDVTTGLDFYPLPETGDRIVSGAVVDAGFGISAPDLGYDDYARVNGRGAVVLIRDGAPARIEKQLGHLGEEDIENATSLSRKIATAVAHGAAAVVLLREYLPAARSEWPVNSSPRSESYRLASDLRAHPEPVVALATRASGELERALRAGRRLTATVVPDLAPRIVTVHNVIGRIEGADPSTRGEVVVIGAHFDHDGTDEDGHIYHGADDNASGTAAVLGAATVLARAAAAGARPARTMLFALWNGEEKGELGAEEFLRSGIAPHVVADINLDMIGRHEEVPDAQDWRFRGFKPVTAAASANTLHLLGYSVAPRLADDVVQANDGIGLTLLEDYDVGAQDLLERSDNWPFTRHGVPAVFLTTGLHPDYHTPQDVASRIDFAKLQRVARLAARPAWLAADGPPLR